MRQVKLIIFMMLALAMMLCPVHSSLSTWSIVAVDPATGDVGVAAATGSLVHVDYLAPLVPGKGAAAVQAMVSVPNRDTVFRLLQEGHSAEEIIQHVSDPDFEEPKWHVRCRQYGIVTLSDGSVSVASFTGDWTDDWAGSQQDIGLSVTVQGNILVGEAVVADAMQAFKKNDEQGYNALPDRLMRALEAGSQAGGDRRCNNDQVTQTAASAFILVARGGDQPYAARDRGITDVGTANAPWLAISVIKPEFGPNAVTELRERYDVWRQDVNPAIEPQFKLTTTWGNVKHSNFVR